MGDTLEFNEIYQEAKGSWVSDTTQTLKINKEIIFQVEIELHILTINYYKLTTGCRNLALF